MTVVYFLKIKNSLGKSVIRKLLARLNYKKIILCFKFNPGVFVVKFG